MTVAVTRMFITGTRPIDLIDTTDGIGPGIALTINRPLKSSIHPVQDTLLTIVFFIVFPQ
jgi:hypothetical protein